MNERLIDIRTPLAASTQTRVEIGEDGVLHVLAGPVTLHLEEMSVSLGILHPTEGVALRATIIADPQGIVRFATANDLSVGRNVDEVLRVLDGLQTGELTACNWKPGERTLG